MCLSVCVVFVTCGCLQNNSRIIIMFGPKRKGLTEEAYILHNEMFHDMLAQNILCMIKMEVQEKLCLFERALCQP